MSRRCSLPGLEGAVSRRWFRFLAILTETRRMSCSHPALIICPSPLEPLKAQTKILLSTTRRLKPTASRTSDPGTKGLFDAASRPCHGPQCWSSIHCEDSRCSPYVLRVYHDSPSVEGIQNTVDISTAGVVATYRVEKLHFFPPLLHLKHGLSPSHRTYKENKDSAPGPYS